METALLVIDMQHFFLSMCNASLGNITALIEHFKAHKLPCILTQHGHSQAELAASPPTSQLVRRWGASGSIAVDSDDWQLIPQIAAHVDEHTPVVGKNTYDAFINTDLDSLLREQRVQRVVVCGVMTDCCCDTTARSAFCRGFETWLVEDACGSASKEQHSAGLKGFAFAFGDVIKTKEVLEKIK
ncbi:MAG: hypothetical protein M1819_001817 [Sarea resinae]|nr:MAG: hypothetical protein M1819_001817 [Sarea resinae]